MKLIGNSLYLVLSRKISYQALKTIHEACCQYNIQKHTKNFYVLFKRSIDKWKNMFSSKSDTFNVKQLKGKYLYKTKNSRSLLGMLTSSMHKTKPELIRRKCVGEQENSSLLEPCKPSPSNGCQKKLSDTKSRKYQTIEEKSHIASNTVRAKIRELPKFHSATILNKDSPKSKRRYSTITPARLYNMNPYCSPKIRSTIPEMMRPKKYSIIQAKPNIYQMFKTHSEPFKTIHNLSKEEDIINKSEIPTAKSYSKNPLSYKAIEYITRPYYFQNETDLPKAEDIIESSDIPKANDYGEPVDNSMIEFNKKPFQYKLDVEENSRPEATTSRYIQSELQGKDINLADIPWKSQRILAKHKQQHKEAFLHHLRYKWNTYVPSNVQNDEENRHSSYFRHKSKYADGTKSLSAIHDNLTLFHRVKRDNRRITHKVSLNCAQPINIVETSSRNRLRKKKFQQKTTIMDLILDKKKQKMEATYSPFLYTVPDISTYKTRKRLSMLEKKSSIHLTRRRSEKSERLKYPSRGQLNKDEDRGEICKQIKPTYFELNSMKDGNTNLYRQNQKNLLTWIPPTGLTELQKKTEALAEKLKLMKLDRQKKTKDSLMFRIASKWNQSQEQIPKYEKFQFHPKISHTYARPVSSSSRENSFYK